MLLFCCRNGHLSDFAEISTARNQKADKLRPSTSDPDLSALSCGDDIPCPVKIYQSDVSYISLLITRVGNSCLKMTLDQLRECHSKLSFN